MTITGWILGGLASLLLLFSGVSKFMPPNEQMEQGMQHVGWTMDKMPTLGILEIASVILYLIPQTAVLGAILITGYMGGAIATHVRVGDSFVVQVIIPIVIWGGIWLRDARLRQVMPFRS